MAGRNNKLEQIEQRVKELNTAYKLLALPIKQSVEINRYTETVSYTHLTLPTSG